MASCVACSSKVKVVFACNTATCASKVCKDCFTACGQCGGSTCKSCKGVCQKCAAGAGKKGKKGKGGSKETQGSAKKQKTGKTASPGSGHYALVFELIDGGTWIVADSTNPKDLKDHVAKYPLETGSFAAYDTPKGFDFSVRKNNKALKGLVPFDLSKAKDVAANRPAAKAAAPAGGDLQAQIDAAALAVREIKAKIKAKKATKDDLAAPLAKLLALKEQQKNGGAAAKAAAPKGNSATGKPKAAVATALKLSSPFLSIEDGFVRWLHPVWKKAFPGKDYAPELLPTQDLEALVKDLDDIIKAQSATIGCAVHDRYCASTAFLKRRNKTVLSSVPKVAKKAPAARKPKASPKDAEKAKAKEPKSKPQKQQQSKKSQPNSLPANPLVKSTSSGGTDSGRMNLTSLKAFEQRSSQAEKRIEELGNLFKLLEDQSATQQKVNELTEANRSLKEQVAKLRAELSKR